MPAPFVNDIRVGTVSIAERMTGVSEHHNYLSEIRAARLMFDEGVVATEACRVYSAARPENELASSSFFGSTWEIGASQMGHVLQQQLTADSPRHPVTEGDSRRIESEPETYRERSKALLCS
jgi:hypothetical protein